MKKAIALAAATAVMAAVWGSLGSMLHAQAPEGAASLPHKVGLIDMGYVFKNYEKFKTLRADLEAEMKQVVEKDQVDSQKIKKLQSDLQLLGKTHNESSPEYQRKEKELADAVASYQTSRKLLERDFMRKEAEIFKTTYLEVADFVKKYAEWRHYTLVMRFNRDEIDDSQNIQETMQQMNRQVIYYQPQDDISDEIIKYLNQAYQRTAGAGAAAVPRAGAVRK